MKLTLEQVTKLILDHAEDNYASTWSAYGTDETMLDCKYDGHIDLEKLTDEINALLADIPRDEGNTDGHAGAA